MLQQKIDNLKIILASQSPRRAQLLREAGFKNVQISPADVDETPPEHLPHFEVAQFLAQKKAHHKKNTLPPTDAIILAADTIVIVPTDNGTQILNKPQHRAEAIAMLELLSNKTHQVVTGVCVLSQSKEEAFSVLTEVAMDELSREEIEFYVDTYQPYDKAGAYAVQEWIGHCKIKSLSGTNTNVMGLPMRELYTVLKQYLQ